MKYVINGLELTEVQLTASEKPVRVAGSHVTYTQLTHAVKGKLRASTQAGLFTDVTTLINSLRDGIFSNCVLQKDDGTDTPHKIVISDTIDGIHLQSGVDFPVGNGAELGLFRTFSFTLDAKIKKAATDLVSFQESITTSGGTMPAAWLLPADPQLEPISQRLRRTPFFIVQSGTARAYTINFTPPAPYLQPDQQSFTHTGREAAEGLAGLYDYKWEYRYSEVANPGLLPHERTLS